jgi:beta-1,4-mannosyltransferase
LSGKSVSTPIRVLAWPAGHPNDQNPYVRMMYSAFVAPEAEVLAFSPLMLRVPAADIFHLQWPEGIFEGRGGSSLWLVRAKAHRILRAAKQIRRDGGRVVITAHNLQPHAALSGPKAKLWVRFHSELLKQTDLIVSLSQAALDDYVRAHPAAREIATTIVPHPHYRDEYPPVTSDYGRTYFQTGSGRLLGIVGSLRPSKGVVGAVQAFRGAAYADEKLLVAGACSETYRLEIVEAIGGDERIIFHPYALTDDQIAAAFAAIDACLINQAGTLNSGTAMLALSLNRPVIAPQVGSLNELKQVVGAEWLALFSPPLDAQRLRSAMDCLNGIHSNLDDKLDRLSPTRLSQRLLSDFRSLLQG